MKRDEKSLNLEPVNKALMNLGLSETDAQVYIYLAKKGPQTGENIAKTLNINIQQANSCLKNLQTKGIANTAFTRFACFFAVPFDKVIDIIAKTKKLEGRNMQKNKEEILNIWESLISGDQTT